MMMGRCFACHSPVAWANATGKQDNCQVAVSLSVATHQGSLPVAYRLYLPKAWADDPARRAIAGVPDDVRFQTKPEIALQQLRQAVADGVPPGVALMDPAYGNDSKLRAGISELGLAYVAGIQPTTMVWRPGEAPLPPLPGSGRGRPGTRLRRDRDASAGLSQDTGSGTRRRCLATDQVARRQQHPTDLAVRPMADSPGTRRRQAERAGSRGVAADRVAGGRSRTGSLLVLHAAGRHLT